MFRLTREQKYLLIIFVIYFFLAWILGWTYFVTHLNNIPNWPGWHHDLLEGTYSFAGNDSVQFRVMSFWGAELTRTFMGTNIWESYIINRLFVTFLLLCAFHLFLLKWFNHRKAFTATLFLAAITPVTYLTYYQEADIYLQFFFLIGLWFIREHRLWWLTGVVLLGTFAKETMVFIVPFFFLYQWMRGKRKEAIWQSLMLIAVWFVVFYGLRHWVFEGSGSKLWQLPHNLKLLPTYFSRLPFFNMALLYIPLYGIFWIFAFMHRHVKPLYLRAAAPFVVIFMVLHFNFGWPEETRLLIPIAFLIIPSGMMSLQQLEDQPKSLAPIK